MAERAGKLHPLLESEYMIWRPIMEGKVTLHEVKSGYCSLADLLKINALMDAKNDIQSAIDKYMSSKGAKR